MEKAGDYSFNKSHAACYALISYRTAYLKANYPVQYMAALISSVMDTKDKVPFYVTVANEMGIEVLPPDINESVVDFRGVEGRIRFGLNAVKNVGETAIRNIIDARDRGGAFTGLFDFCERVDLGIVNQRAVESLVKSGAMDSIGPSRRGMLQVLPQAMAHGKKMRADADRGQGSIFDLFSDPEPTAAKNGGGNGNGARGDERRSSGGHPRRRLQQGRASGAGEGDAGPVCELAPAQGHPARDTAGGRTPHLPTGRPARRHGDHHRGHGEHGQADHHQEVRRDHGLCHRGGPGGLRWRCSASRPSTRRTRSCWSQDKVVKIKGRVDHKDEAEIKFIPMAIEAFVPKTGLEPLALSVDGECLPYTVIDDLKHILARFPGKCSVEMYVRHGETSRRLRFGDGFRVDPQASLFAELKALLGEACVCQGPPRNGTGA